jgi:hypothetical protein
MSKPNGAVVSEAFPLRFDFSKTGNGTGCLRDGWGASENRWTWTNGLESRIELPDLDPGVAYQCEIDLWPFTNPPYLLSQELQIWLGNTELLRTVMTAWARTPFTIPAHSARPLVLTLRSPGNIAPLAVGAGTDVRSLAFAVSAVTVLSQDPPAAVPEVRAPVVVPAAARALPKVAAVTMVYNEIEYLPIWLRHYGRHVGPENCFVVDHGSEDGSTNAIGQANRVRIPRSPYDPFKQSFFNSDFCSSLLHWYDWVIYSDVDELMLPDPRVASTLREYCLRDLPEVVNAIGLNTIHVPDREPDIDLARPISEQRSYVFINSSMCKPLLIRRPVRWSPGSHSADAPVHFDHLYMFHQRWFDLNSGMRRLQRTRAMAWAREDAGRHQRVEDDKLRQMYTSFSNLPKLDGIDFDPKAPPVADFLQRIVDSQKGREDQIYRISLDLWPTHLWRLPQRFVGSF